MNIYIYIYYEPHILNKYKIRKMMIYIFLILYELYYISI